MKRVLFVAGILSLIGWGCEMHPPREKSPGKPGVVEPDPGDAVDQRSDSEVRFFPEASEK